MKRTAILVFSMVLNLGLNAQRSFFIFLQTENRQPFFVKWEERIYSSNDNGYLILSQVKDTTHHFSIGLPGTEIRESFLVTMNHKDHGYLVKHFAEKGWTLFDLQTLGIQMPTRAPLPKDGVVIKTEKKTSSQFSDLLSRAANDTTLDKRYVLEETAANKPNPGVVRSVPDSTQKKDSTTHRSVTGTTGAITGNSNSPAMVKKEAGMKEVKKDSLVSARLENQVKDTNAVGATKKSEPLLIESGGNERASVKLEKPVTKKEEQTGAGGRNAGIDTTTIKKVTSPPAVTTTEMKPVIVEEKKPLPVEKAAVKNQHLPEAGNVIKRSETSTSDGVGMVYVDQYAGGKNDTIRLLIPVEPSMLRKPETNKETAPRKSELRFLDIIPDTSYQDRKQTTSSAPVSGTPEKPACNRTATDEDFFNVRKDMAGEIREADMIEKAKPVFAVTCFSTEQVKNLGHLFLSEQSKLLFYQEARAHLTDPENFPSLAAGFREAGVRDAFQKLLNTHQ